MRRDGNNQVVEGTDRTRTVAVVVMAAEVSKLKEVHFRLPPTGCVDGGLLERVQDFGMIMKTRTEERFANEINVFTQIRF